MERCRLSEWLFDFNSEKEIKCFMPAVFSNDYEAPSCKRKRDKGEKACTIEAAGNDQGIREMKYACLLVGWYLFNNYYYI